MYANVYPPYASNWYAVFSSLPQLKLYPSLGIFVPQKAFDQLVHKKSDKGQEAGE